MGIGIDYQILVLIVKYWYWYWLWNIGIDIAKSGQLLISGRTTASDGDGLVLHEASNDLLEEEGREEEVYVPTWDHSNLIPMTIIHG